jgi:nicotinate-nucleotide pyrophosphorylase (carboxylating)
MRHKILQSEWSVLIRNALNEDLGEDGDVTSLRVVDPAARAVFKIVARDPLIMCGGEIAKEVFSHVSNAIDCKIIAREGSVCPPQSVLLRGEGPAQAVFSAERVALNFLRQTCGVATITRRYVEKVEGTSAKILDTRKTIPSLRSLQKYAVRTGGGMNHRMGLFDAILIKDNHIAISGSIKKAVDLAKSGTKKLSIEVECDTIAQVKEALLAVVDRILLDNMSIELIKEAVSVVNGKIPLEASGNMTLPRVREVAETGVQFISVGRLTNAPDYVDIGLDL